jgi:hypothetical protein
MSLAKCLCRRSKQPKILHRPSRCLAVALGTKTAASPIFIALNQSSRLDKSVDTLPGLSQRVFLAGDQWAEHGPCRNGKIGAGWINAYTPC